MTHAVDAANAESVTRNTRSAIHAWAGGALARSDKARIRSGSIGSAYYVSNRLWAWGSATAFATSANGRTGGERQTNVGEWHKHGVGSCHRCRLSSEL